MAVEVQIREVSSATLKVAVAISSVECGLDHGLVHVHVPDLLVSVVVELPLVALARLALRETVG